MTSCEWRTQRSLAAETAMPRYEIVPTASNITMAAPNVSCILRFKVSFDFNPHQLEKGVCYSEHDPEGLKRAACDHTGLFRRELNAIPGRRNVKVGLPAGVA